MANLLIRNMNRTDFNVPAPLSSFMSYSFSSCEMSGVNFRVRVRLCDVW